MKKLLILSGKGGTGKTTTAAAFIGFSRSRAIADCDVDAPNLHLVFSRKSEPQFSDFFGGDKALIDSSKCIGCGICMEHCRFDAIEQINGSYAVNEFSCEGCGVCEQVCPQAAVTLQADVAGRKELYLEDGVFSTATLKMGRGNSGKLVSDVKMAMLKNAPETDIAIIDGSPGIGCPVIASINGVDLVLVVAEPSLSGISDLERLVDSTRSFRTKMAVCVNKWDLSPESTQSIRDFCRSRELPFVGCIPYDKSASRAINEGLSLAEVDCPAALALREIYENTIKLLK